jgi:hypothetical protein
MIRPYEQIAIRTRDVDARVREMQSLTQTNSEPQVTRWILDTVSAINVYTVGVIDVGSIFTVRLAFNYGLIPGKELELIGLLSGETCQMMDIGTGKLANEGLSHLGYHIPDGADLRDEIDQWERSGQQCMQVSRTVVHSGTRVRYEYAYIDTRSKIGAWTKIISRVPMNDPTTIDEVIQKYRSR